MRVHSKKTRSSSVFLTTTTILLFSFCLYSCSDEETDSSYKDVSTIDIIVSDTNKDIEEDTIDIHDSSFDIVSDTSDISGTDITDTIQGDIINEDITSNDVNIADINIIDEGNDTYTDINPDIFEDANTSDTEILDSGTIDTSTNVIQPIINEIMIKPNFSDGELGQYIELYNPNNFGVDIDGYKLKTDSKEYIISSTNCDTVIQPLKYFVIGATTDLSKNSYAKVKCEWKDSFTLTGAQYLELVRSDNQTVEKIMFNNLNVKKGSSLERSGNQFTSSPSLITFLDDTGLYKGDRGSPNRPNYILKIKTEITEGSVEKDRIEKENEVLRYPINLSKGDIIAFFADVDRVNGDLKLFASLLDNNEDFITPLDYVSDITYDYFIYQITEYNGKYYFQIQSDFFYQFAPANIEASYYRADGLRTNKNFVEIKIGDNFQIESYATFSQNKDLKEIRLSNDMLIYKSNDPTIAEVSQDGIITGKNIGSTTVYVTYYYLDSTNITNNIVVNVYSQPTNDTCKDAIDATAGLNIYASTIGAADDYNPEECVFSLFSGPDIVYFVDAEPNSTYEVLVTPYGSFDPMIYVLNDCSNMQCLYGTVLNGAGDPEKLTFKNESFSIRRFYIIIDGEAGDYGSFTLSITKK